MKLSQHLSSIALSLVVVQACAPADPDALSALKRHRAINMHKRHPQHHHKRQTTATTGSTTSVSTATGTGTDSTAATGTGIATATLNPATFSVPTDPFATIELDHILSGAPPEPTGPLPSVYSAGQVPAGIANAPGLPPATLNPADYPALNVVPPTDSDQVKTWMQEIAGIDPAILNIPPSTDGTVAGSPDAVADKSRCWWTATACTGPEDIVTCPTKDTWGLSFDDGPSFYTPKVLNYLDKNDLKATFFVVGSRLMDAAGPTKLQTTYMMGNHIAAHTWSHSVPLTALTNEELVAELGWSRKVINDVLGVTPLFMRPPWGDIDNRVRAISLAMGMRPIIWTRNPETLEQFDTNDWRVAAGQFTGEQSLQQFQYILGNATLLNTGFIVLQHDLYQVEVDLSTGYTIPLALQSKFNLMDINTCIGGAPADAYRETIANKSAIPTFPGAGSVSESSVSGNSSSSGSGSSGGNVAQGTSAAASTSLSLLVATLAALFGSLVVS